LYLDGNIQKLREGIWTNKVRIGYKRVWEGKKSKIVQDENAKYIKTIFELRGNQLMEVPAIYNYLVSIGCTKIKEKNIYKILTNEFYAGYYTHGLLDKDEIIKAAHEPIVSEDLFKKVNSVFQDKNRKVRHEYTELCLKSFVKCDTCGKNLTAYYKKDKDKFYYKCGTKGCKFNRSSEKMEDAFLALLRCLKLSEEEKVKVRAELIGLTGDFMAKNDELNKKLRGNLIRHEEELKAVKINFGKGKIDEDVYSVTKEEVESEIAKTLQELKKTEIKISNFSENITKGLEMLDSIDVLWENNSVEGRKRVQKALIKTPLIYDRKKGHYRTLGLVDFVLSNAVVARGLELPENKNPQQFVGDSPTVACTGIEPLSSNV